MTETCPQSTVQTTGGPLVCAHNPGVVYRVGFPPQPWAWPGWEYAGTDGRFSGRWDDADGSFRTVYAATTLLGCLIEVLAPFRPDPALESALSEVVEDPEDANGESAPAGTVPASWLQRRQASRAHLSGTYCAVTNTQTVATLRTHFLTRAVVDLNLPDFDAAALKLAEPRRLTQEVASWLWSQTAAGSEPAVDGVRFLSRHGDDHELWAVFERDVDGVVSRRVSGEEPIELYGAPQLDEAMNIHGLHWAAAPR